MIAIEKLLVGLGLNEDVRNVLIITTFEVILFMLDKLVLADGLQLLAVVGRLLGLIIHGAL